MKKKDRWIKSKLSEFIEIEMGQSPKSEFYNSNGLGMPFLQGNRTFGDRYPYFDTYCTENRKIALKKDIIMSVRAPVGDLNIATENISIGRGVCALRAKNKQNDFLYYLLKYNIKNLINKESGTVFGSVNKNDILGLEINYPENIEIQEKIADILSALDDKIEINNEMNKILEEMAQTLFKRWFIDFEFPNENGEPYKSSGGKMIESELGEIPEGWRIGTLEEIIENFDSKRKPLSKKERDLRENKYPYYGAAGVIDYVDNYLFDGEYILLGEDGTVMSPSETPILNYINEKFWVSNHAHVIKAKHVLNNEYLYYLLNNTNISHIITGAVQLKINQKNLNNLKILIPQLKIVNSFGVKSLKLTEMIRNNKKETQSLTEIRDTLLPKLMSGEIEV